MALHVIILAAGAGKRMFSETPKVLHRLGGKPLLTRVLETANQLNPQQIHIVYGHGGDKLKQEYTHEQLHWVLQKEQLGTGHAVLQALPFIPPTSTVLILSADVPLIQASTLQALIAKATTPKSTKTALTLLVALFDNPSGLGRILRNDLDHICAIMEEKDASFEEKQIKEIYTGICVANAADLKRWLPQLKNENVQKEYYLTEIISLAFLDKHPIHSFLVKNNAEIQGVNNRLQLQQLERLWQYREAEKFLLQGVTIADPTRFDIRGELRCGRDVYIDINCIILGDVFLGDGSSVGPNCILNNVKAGAGCQIFANSVLEQCELGDHCHIGPFARLRPQTQLAAHCKIGNFVETKNIRFGEKSKANHLTYLGDAHIGKNVNIGAGTITCNYDGANKHLTIIEDHVSIGSDTQLVAPVIVGANATVGAGSTIRENVPADHLTLTESRQKTIIGWQRPVKKKDND